MNWRARIISLTPPPTPPPTPVRSVSLDVGPPTPPLSPPQIQISNIQQPEPISTTQATQIQTSVHQQSSPTHSRTITTALDIRCQFPNQALTAQTKTPILQQASSVTTTITGNIRQSHQHTQSSQIPTQHPFPCLRNSIPQSRIQQSPQHVQAPRLIPSILHTINTPYPVFQMQQQYIPVQSVVLQEIHIQTDSRWLHQPQKYFSPKSKIIMLPTFGIQKKIIHLKFPYSINAQIKVELAIGETESEDVMLLESFLYKILPEGTVKTHSFIRAMKVNILYYFQIYIYFQMFYKND